MKNWILAIIIGLAISASHYLDVWHIEQPAAMSESTRSLLTLIGLLAVGVVLVLVFLAWWIKQYMDVDE